MYEKVAWFGGSFSPPTKMHTVVAKEVGNALGEMTDNSCVYIVPVSSGYNKPSVKEKCIPTNQRKELVKSFIEGLNDKGIHYELFSHEIDSPNSITTADSLKALEVKTGLSKENIYIVQGQDNVEHIFSRKWNNPDELLEYKIMIFPRGNETREQIKVNLAKNLVDSNKEGGVKHTTESAKILVDQLIFIGEGFQDDTSSSLVRKLIKEGEPYDHLLDPAVYAKLQEFKGVYMNCEAVGGRTKVKSKRQKPKGKSRAKGKSQRAKGKSRANKK